MYLDMLNHGDIYLKLRPDQFINQQYSKSDLVFILHGNPRKIKSGLFHAKVQSRGNKFFYFMVSLS